MDKNVIKLTLTPNGLLNIESLEKAVNHLKNGGLVILPTETGYLLAANALDEEAVKKVFVAKGRPNTNPIHVVVSGIEMAERYVELSPMAKKLIYRFQPGPVTPICPKREIVSDYLVANTGYLGIRIPDVPMVIQVVDALDMPITATSLNISGDTAKKSLEEVIDEMHWEGQMVYYAKQDEAIIYDKPSTLVKFTGEEWTVLREGPVGEAEIAEVLK